MLDQIKAIFSSLEYVAISTLFGFGSFLYKVKYENLPQNKSNFIHELMFSTMAGYLAYKICNYLNINENLIGIVIGVASYSGTRFILKISRMIERHIEIKFNGEVYQDNDIDSYRRVDSNNRVSQNQPTNLNRNRITYRI